MQRYGVLKCDASIILNICIKNVLYNIYLILEHVLQHKTAVF